MSSQIWSFFSNWMGAICFSWLIRNCLLLFFCFCFSSIFHCKFIFLQIGPSFAAHQPVIFNPQASSAPQPYFHPNGPQVCVCFFFGDNIFYIMIAYFYPSTHWVSSTTTVVWPADDDWSPSTSVLHANIYSGKKTFSPFLDLSFKFITPSRRYIIRLLLMGICFFYRKCPTKEGTFRWGVLVSCVWL